MARKSAPFSMRLPPLTDELITQEARRTRRSKGAVVASLAEEALQMRRFPGIAFRGSDGYRRPWVMGTALDVWQIIIAVHGDESAGELAARTDLTEAQAALALAYYREFPDEIDDAIRDNERPLEELQREFPTIETIVVE